MLKPKHILRRLAGILAVLVAVPMGAAPDQDAQRLANQANLAMAEEDWEKADELLEEALGIAEDAPELWIGRGFTRKQLAKIDDARESLETALELYRERAEDDPDNTGLVMNVGYTLVLLNRRDDALDYLRAAAERNPEERVFGRFEEIIDGIEENFSEFILPKEEPESQPD